LKKIIPRERPYIVFCPLAEDSHVDHIIVREACLKNFDRVIMWSDFPYNVRNMKDTNNAGSIGVEAFAWHDRGETKKKMINSYTSQVHAMFPDGSMPVMREIYYVLKKELTNERIHQHER